MEKTARPESLAVQNLFLIEVNKIKAAPWNPPNRLEQERLRGLEESIADLGLLYPLLIDEKNCLIDGHRRLATVKKLGWKHVQVIKVSSEFEYTYGSIQQNQSRLSGNDLLYVYLNNRNALIGSQRRKIEAVETICGLWAVKSLYDAGLSSGTLNIAIKLCRYLEQKLDVSVVLKWVIKYSMGCRMRHLIESGVSPASIKRAIENDRPIKVKMTAVDE